MKTRMPKNAPISPGKPVGHTKMGIFVQEPLLRKSRQKCGFIFQGCWADKTGGIRLLAGEAAICSFDTSC